jgi:uncharacterized protein (TIGR01777 family)
MKILITGGTGLIGRQLCRELLQQGHQLTVLSRHADSVAVNCGSEVSAWTSLNQWLPTMTFDAVINLAGEPIADKNWSPARKQILWDSRVTLTKELVNRISAAHQKPSVILSGSAIGIYGDRADLELAESSSPGNDFAAELCLAWEAAAMQAASLGVRVCLLRTGLVLSRSGGLLSKMRLPFRLGMGARLGKGLQWMSWINLDDHVAIVIKMLGDQTMQGPYNLTAPNPVTNAQFTRALALALHRPAWFVAPEFLLKIALGERASLFLGGQRVMPVKLEQLGFSFNHPEINEALSESCH